MLLSYAFPTRSPVLTRADARYEWDRGAQQRARDYNISIVTEENFEEVMSGSDAVLLVSTSVQ